MSTIPTEPIGSIPRPAHLIERVATGDTGDPDLAALYHDAIQDTIARFEATGSPVVTDGEQRKYQNFTTYSAHGLPNTAPDGFATSTSMTSHEHVSQRLSVLKIKIDQLRASTDITPAIGAALDELRRDTSEIGDDVYRLSHRLHSSTLDYLGLVAALQKLVAEFSERHGIAIAFAHRSLPPSLPSEVALCLFRVAEESLTNIAKHSQARWAHVQVAGTSDGIHLRVEDAGVGFAMTALGSYAGLGFVSMQERLRVLRGTLHVDSAPSRGTRIEAWVPAAMLVTKAHDQTAHRSETA